MLPQHLQLNGSSSSNNPYLIEQLQFMQHQETSPSYQISNTNYFSPTWVATTPRERRTMASWSYDIVDACSIDRQAAVIGMTYFDRFLSTSSSSSSNERAKAALTNRREFQLAFIACLCLALKCRAGMQVDSDFVSATICQNLYTNDEIIDTEKEVLKALQWRLNGPSPHEFIDGLVELLPTNGNTTRDAGELFEQRLKSVAKIQAEVAMLDFDMARKSPSSIAFAALLSSANVIGADAAASRPPEYGLAWMQNIASVTGMNANDAKYRELRDELAGMVQQQLFGTPPSSSSNQASDDYCNDDDDDDDAAMISSSTPEVPETTFSREQELLYNRITSSIVSSSGSSSSVQSEEESETDYDELYLEAISSESSNEQGFAVGL
jgi:hypothetical protein